MKQYRPRRFPALSNACLAALLVAALVALAGCRKTPEANSGGETASVVRITGIPDENPTELQRRSQPLMDYLAAKLGRKIEYVPVTDYGAAVQALAAGKVDFAWLGGFSHVQARRLAEVEPLVMRDIDREFKSVFIVHTDSGIERMADLPGKTFAFGSKSSTSGHLMPRHFLETEFDIRVDDAFSPAPMFSGAHDATAKAVESGRVQAGVLNHEVYERLVREKKLDPSKVRAIWTTPGYVDYNWTARKALDSSLREAFREAFLALDPANPKHKSIVALQGGHAYVRAKASDFDAIEKVAKKTGLLK